MDLGKIIRDVKDFPKKGIVFKDITTVLKDSDAFKYAVGLMMEKYKGQEIDYIVGIESRGFIFGSIIAYELGSGFIPARKSGKLPYKTIKREYALEYGTNALELHVDAIEKGKKVVIVDDLLATGGTALAVCQLVEALGGDIVGVEFLIELEFLNGRDKLKKYKVNSYVKVK